MRIIACIKDIYRIKYYKYILKKIFLFLKINKFCIKDISKEIMLMENLFNKKLIINLINYNYI